MDTILVEIPTTRDVCVNLEHTIPDNVSRFDWINSDHSFLEEFGDVYDASASTEFICFAILEKPNPRFQNLPWCSEIYGV